MRKKTLWLLGISLLFLILVTLLGDRKSVV